MCLLCEQASPWATPGPEPSAGRAAWLWTELVTQRRQLRLDGHPYITAWRKGELTPADIQILAAEHQHVVFARAALAHLAARRATGAVADFLVVIAEDADTDVERWLTFSKAAGWCRANSWYYGEDPLPETMGCAARLTGSPRDSLAQCVARLYALLAAQHDVAPVQASGLVHHAAIDETADVWFRRRVGDGRILSFLEGPAAEVFAMGDPFEVIAAARTSYESLWSFYDGLAANRARRSAPASSNVGR